jgi:hypothetical protein
MRWSKVLGLAGILGVTATGVMIVRHERARRAYTADEIRDRLHARLAESDATTPDDAQETTGPTPSRRGWRRA